MKSGNNYNVNCFRRYETGHTITYKRNRTAQNPRQYQIHTNHSSTNTFGSRSYAQVISQSPPSDNQYHNNISNDTTEIKELLKQSIKNTEILTRMISEQNAVLKQQTQQITVMLQLLTNVLSKK